MKVTAWTIAVSILFTLVPAAAISNPVTVVFTTTADYDSGDKNDPGPLNFLGDGVDQTQISYITEPQGIYSSLHDKTYISYFCGVTQIQAGLCVTYFNHGTQAWKASPVLLPGATLGDLDSHRNPAILPLANGRVVAAGGVHDNNMRFWRTTTTNGEIDSWEELTNPDTGPDTYPKLIEYPTGTLWLFYRSGGFDPISYRKSTNSGTTWTAETLLIQMSPDGIYSGGVIQVGSVLYWPWTMVHVPTTTERRHAFLCKFNMATGTWASLTGTSLGASITRAEAFSDCQAIDSGDTGETDPINNQPQIDVISASSIYMLYPQAESPYDPEDWHLNFTHWDGASWSLPVDFGVQTGESSSYFDLDMASDDSGIAIITTIGINTGCTGDCLFTGNLEKWNWDGTDWLPDDTNFLTQTKAGETTNTPSFIKNGKPELRAVMGHFINVAGFDFGTPRKTGDQHLFAWGDGGFLHGSGDDGFFGVETITDNKYVTDGSFTLANPKNLKWNEAETDPENWNWRYMQTQDGQGDCSRTASGGVLNFTWTSGGGTGRRACGVKSTFQVEGDFDIRIKAQVTDAQEGGGNSGPLFKVFTTPLDDLEWSQTYDHISGMIIRKIDGAIQARMADGGAQIADSGFIGDVGSGLYTVHLRITRTGDDWTAYRSADGSSWTQILAATGTDTGQEVIIYAAFRANSVFAGTMSTTFDDFDVVTGTLGSDSFRQEGTWTSALEDQEGVITPQSINLTYSGVSSTRFIDSVRLVSASGAVLFEDETDITSGTFKSIPVPQSNRLRTDWSVEVDLVGDGSGSATVSEIAILTNEFRTTAERAFTFGGWILLFIFLVAIFLIIGWLVKRRREE